jgi:hypothetical protein
MSKQSTITVQVLSDTSKFNISKVNKDLDGLGKSVDTSDSKLSKLGSGVQKATLPAMAAISGITAGLFSSTKAAEEAAATQAKLDQVFASMGYSENAKAATDYAESLSKIIGVDDDIIKGAQTKLATFSEVAKSAETMGRATSIAADLSAAGFGSMDSASVMLGKALQDPIKGVGALGRVGVTFTEQEKAMIEQMVKAGDTAGAQAMIMKALETQVGGVAEASATGSDKMALAFGEIGEAVGAILLPAMETLMPLIQGFANWAADNPELLLTIAAIIGTVAGAVIAINAAMKIWSAVSAAVAIANAIMGASFTIALGPIALVIAAVAAVIAIGVLLYKNWDSISAWLKDTWETIKDVAGKVWDAIKKALEKVWEAIKAAVEWYFNAYKTVIVGVWNAIKTAAETVWNAVSEFLSGIWETIKTGVTNAWNGIKEFLTGLWDTLKTKVSEAFTAMKEAVSTALDNIFTFVKELPGKILGFYANFYTLLFQKGKDLITGMWNGLKEMWSTAASWLGEIGDKALDALGNLGSVLFEKGKDLVEGLIRGIKSMAGKVKDILLDLVPGPLRNVVGNILGRSTDLPVLQLRDFGTGTTAGSFYSTYNPSGTSGVYAPRVTYNIEVQTMVADRRAGATIVDAIKEYERTASGAWRR